MIDLSWTANRAIRTYESDNHRAELRIYGRDATYVFGRTSGALPCDIQNAVLVHVDHHSDQTRVVWSERARWIESGRESVGFRCDGLWVDVTVPGTSEAAVLRALSTARARAPASHPIPAGVRLQDVVEV